MKFPKPFPFPFTGTTTRPVTPRFFTSSTPAPLSPRPPYFVPRNSRGSLPIYSDIRNGGTRYLISVRNVEGNIKALAGDLIRDLSNPISPESNRLKARITRSNHLVLSGLTRKHAVLDWLVSHGF
ncbi:54S ribosomal protein img2, mitochondrial [Lactarius tabidus]